MPAIKLFRKTRLIHAAKNLRKSCEGQTEGLELIDKVKASGKFCLIQKISEFNDFLDLVKDLRPKIICDIGSSGGGTIRLFSHLAEGEADIISIDIDNTPLRQAAFPHLVGANQKLWVIHASSYADQTISQVKDYLGERKIDLLFIDGDHEYEGVKKDFELYSPLVRQGGIIGFHDIVEDNKIRYGKETDAWVGGVPKYWNELKQNNDQVKEIIENPQQDGFGIGVIFK